MDQASHGSAGINKGQLPFHLAPKWVRILSGLMYTRILRALAEGWPRVRRERYMSLRAIPLGKSHRLVTCVLGGVVLMNSVISARSGSAGPTLWKRVRDIASAKPPGRVARMKDTPGAPAWGTGVVGVLHNRTRKEVTAEFQDQVAVLGGLSKPVQWQRAFSKAGVDSALLAISTLRDPIAGGFYSTPGQDLTYIDVWALGNADRYHYRPAPVVVKCFLRVASRKGDAPVAVNLHRQVGITDYFEMLDLENCKYARVSALEGGLEEIMCAPASFVSSSISILDADKDGYDDIVVVTRKERSLTIEDEEGSTAKGTGIGTSTEMVSQNVWVSLFDPDHRGRIPILWPLFVND